MQRNPADIPSRGMSACLLTDTELWLNGPDFLYFEEELPEEINADHFEEELPEEINAAHFEGTIPVD